MHHTDVRTRTRTRTGWVLKGKKVLYVLPRSVEIKEDTNPASPATYVVYSLPLKVATLLGSACAHAR
jgi:hypothetical protein